MLDLRKLRVLSSVVTSGSISSAAANLGYTPSAVSQQISALGKETGIALLEKNGRGVRPTAAGKILVEHAASIMAAVSEAELALTDLREGRTGRLRMTYFSTAGAALVPPAVAAFRRDHPGVTLDLKLNEPAYRARDLGDDPADIELVVLRADSPVPRGIRLIHLFDDPYRIVLPRGHSLARRSVLDLAELADEPWVDNEFPSGVCRDVMLDACSAAGFTPNFVVESDDYPTAQGFVAAGIGVTLVPKLGLGAVPQGVVVRRIRHPEPVRSIYAVVREAVADRPVISDMVQALKGTQQAVAEA